MLCDVTNSFDVEKAIKTVKPDIILHLASKSNVDYCEPIENRKEIVKVNYTGTRNAFTLAEQLNIPCVLFSSAQIWKGGFWEKPHREMDKKNIPVNYYGLSKLGAENIAEAFDGYIIRLSYVFDYCRLAPKIEALRGGEEIWEPTFIRRSFIYLEDFVSLVLIYCAKIGSMPKVLHLAGSETDSWYEFMHEVACQYGLDPSLVRPRRKEDKKHAPRPHNGGLNTYLARSLGFRIPDYVDGIRRMKNAS